MDRNFSILPHDPFLDMAFPRPLRKNKIYKKRFFYFFAALKGVCGWPIDRQENSKRDCEVVSCCWALRTTCTCFIMICYCLKYFLDYILYVQTKKWFHTEMKSSLTGWLWVQQVEQWEDDHRQTEELFQGDKKVISYIDRMKMTENRMKTAMKMNNRLQSTLSRTRAWSRRSRRTPRWPGRTRSAGWADRNIISIP